MASERIRLFAVLIGINSLRVPSADYRPLKGAVTDARSFKEYLENYLDVPSSHIQLLTDKDATRSKILDALKHLSEDKRIDKGDAIFLYYAGHGGLIDDPREFGEVKKEQIQSIVPYDCDVIDRSGKRVPPIPDYVLEIFLSKIAAAKGDNITVIFDCCHSASGTRGGKFSINNDEIIRSVELPSSTAYFEQLRREISEVETASRGTYISPKFIHRGLGSHILLAACGSMELATEYRGHGRFSIALLNLLQQVPPGTLRYSEILRHPRFDRISGQEPQCEGSNTDRTLFDGKVLPAQRKWFPLYYDESNKQYIVQGGTMHNITLNSEFDLYRAIDTTFSKRICTLRVAQLRAFSFTPKFPPDAPTLDPTIPTIAIQTKFGKMEPLRIYIPLQDGFYKIYKGLVQNPALAHHFGNVLRVSEYKNIQIEVMMNANNEVSFTMHNCVDKPITRDAVEVDYEDLARIFSKAAHFYRELKHDDDIPRIKHFVDVELYRLRVDYDTDKYGYAIDILKPDGANLCVNRRAQIFVPDKEAEHVPYGIRLVNRSGLGLYANVFHFNSYDLSISSCANSHHGHTDNGPDIPLVPKGGSLEIGFGRAGYRPISFKIPDRFNIDVGFLKIYLSTESVSLAYLPQLSPFVRTRGIAEYVPKPQVMWTAIVVPTILRRQPT